MNEYSIESLLKEFEKQADAQLRVVMRNWLESMGDDESRLELVNVMREMMCLHCGRMNPKCQCWNDE